MKDKYKFYKGFYDVFMGIGMNLSEDESSDKRLQYLAETSVMKRVFNCFYARLLWDKELKPIEEMPVEYKQELWDIANQFMKEGSTDEKAIYCKCIMATLWLMNN